MLDKLRKKASSWMTKVIFGLIILSFIFFFGYTSIKSARSGKHGDAVAVVGGLPITQTQFTNVYEQQAKQFNKDGDTKLPENIREFLKNNVLQNLIQKKTMYLMAKDIGVEISDQGLATTIQNHPLVAQGGNFDIILYEERIRPYYSSKIGQDLEDYIAEETILGRFNDLLFNSMVIPEEETKWREEFDKTKASKEKTDYRSAIENETASQWLEQFLKTIKIETFET